MNIDRAQTKLKELKLKFKDGKSVIKGYTQCNYTWQQFHVHISSYIYSTYCHQPSHANYILNTKASITPKNASQTDPQHLSIHKPSSHKASSGATSLLSPNNNQTKTNIHARTQY
jgi:hypothetical protein